MSRLQQSRKTGSARVVREVKQLFLFILHAFPSCCNPHPLPLAPYYTHKHAHMHSPPSFCNYEERYSMCVSVLELPSLILGGCCNTERRDRPPVASQKGTAVVMQVVAPMWHHVAPHRWCICTHQKTTPHELVQALYQNPNRDIYLLFSM